MNKHTHLCVDLVQSQTMLHENSSERGEGLRYTVQFLIRGGGGAAETERLGKRVKQGAKCWRAHAESLWKLFLTPVNLYQLQTHTSHNWNVWHYQIHTHEHIIILSHTSFMSTSGESRNRNVCWLTKKFLGVLDKNILPWTGWRSRCAHEHVFLLDLLWQLRQQLQKLKAKDKSNAHTHILTQF